MWPNTGLGLVKTPTPGTGVVPRVLQYLFTSIHSWDPINWISARKLGMKTKSIAVVMNIFLYIESFIPMGIDTSCYSKWEHFDLRVVVAVWFGHIVFSEDSDVCRSQSPSEQDCMSPLTALTLTIHYPGPTHSILHSPGWVIEEAISTNPTHTSKHVQVLAVIKVVQVENKGYPPKNNV